MFTTTCHDSLNCLLYDGALVRQGIKLFATTACLVHVTSQHELTVMAAPIALIQGASRGLGLEFCKHILRNKHPAAVIATCRSPDGAAELRRVAEQHPGRVTVLRLDVDREEEVRSAAARVKETFGRLDLLVNSSAMLHPSGKGETSLRDVSAQVKLKVVKDILHEGLVPLYCPGCTFIESLSVFFSYII